MKSFFTFIAITVIGLPSIAQSDYTGFYGKKNFIEVTSVSYIPFIPNALSSTGYKTLGTSTSLVSGKRWFNTGFRLSAGKAFKNNLAASIEVGIDYNKIYENLIPYNATDATINDPNGIYYYDFYRHESVSVQHFRIMPKIEFTSFDGLLPAGLVHQVGLGYRRSKIIDKDYVVSLSTGSSVPTGYEPHLRNLINTEQWYTGMQLLYALKMRTPIGRSLFISYGFRYTLDFRLPTDILISFIGEESNTNRAIAKSQFRNFMSFDLGLTMPF
ncbi:MAG: hypothetical protein MK066_05195 [Crocinitomicaceae bacterium]|nr:hypothetical protein [Crocinitomicaceae bacterium]